MGHAQFVKHPQVEPALAIERILAKIDLALIEVSPDEERDQLRTAAPIQDAIHIIKALSIPTSLPDPEVSAEMQEDHLEELDVTWRNKGKFLRLITYGNGRPPKIYFHVDREDPFTGAHSIHLTQPANRAAALNEKLNWLLT